MLPKNCYLAAIDLGSNSFRLEIDHYLKGKIFRKHYLREPVRLGRGLNAENILAQDSIERGWRCLKDFKKLLRSLKIAHIRAVATQTLRVAKNSDVFIKKGEKILSCPIEIIPGEEEARLIYLGVTAMLDKLKPQYPAYGERRLVTDIGGRSTELIVGQAMHPIAAQSTPIGSVGMTMDFFADKQFSSAQINQAIEHAKTLFAAAQQQLQADACGTLVWDKAYGASGTIGAVSSVLKTNKITDGRITRPALEWMRDQLIQAGSVDALKMPGLGDRQDVVGGGLAIIIALFDTFERLEELFPTRGALRQGIVFEMLVQYQALSQP